MFRRKTVPVIEPRWLFLGLGNPGGEYVGTRHNVGFETIRVLSEKNRIKLTTRKFSSHFGAGILGGTPVVLAKPMTYMNRSGAAAAELLRHFNLPAERLVVIFDDMDLRLGRVQIRPQGGSGSHNGMRDLLKVLGTKDFPRIRVGIGPPAVAGIDHVLGRFTPEEIEEILPAIEEAARGCELIAQDGIELAMNRTNKPEENVGTEAG
ncbi:MAG TPA: aminoacyl-tRNA hydrolase [Fimbriimonadales bacterium]|jgi:PTH1 family peptidyl-tRNA hydrolase|nr:aminoacyl-tRNA hydrolase [Fimbriimonadales bacterium]